MVPFYVLFDGKSNIEYNGKIISRYFELKEAGEYLIKFRFISADSEFNQAIVLFFNDFVGEYYLFDEKRKIPQKRFPKTQYWIDTAPREIEVKIQLQAGCVLICNGSDPLGTKQICHSLCFGCAIYIEKIGDNTYRFNCNDHENDDDFDDLIFEVEIRKTGD